MSECTHDCGSCSANCSERKQESLVAQPHKDSHIKKVIGVVSGKGGVGKSMVTSMSAVLMNRRGYRSAVLDADITGPSIPQAFGLHEKAQGNETEIFPVTTETGIKVISVNLLLPDETDPVIWRGPIIAGTAKQFWTDVAWGDVDYMFVDMPPGTGDVPLTVFQSIPVDGIVMVTSPQQLVSLIVKKALNMAESMHIPVLGLVENYSYVVCPDCGKEFKIFGDSGLDGLAEELDLPILGRMPIEPKLAELADGHFDQAENQYLSMAEGLLMALEG